MKSLLHICLFWVIIVVSSFSSFAQDDELTFFKGSFDDLTGIADVNNKCYILFFTKDHCPPCDRMKEETFTDPTVVSLLQEKAIMFEADIQEFDGIALAEQFEVSAYPTLLIFSPKGVLIGKLIGGQSVISLISFLETLAS